MRWARPARPVFCALRLGQLCGAVLAAALGCAALTWAVASRPGATPGQAGPLAGWRVAIDPGHGGEDSGACHPASGLEEKAINLDLAFRLERALEALGAEVVLTRREDVDVAPQEAVQFANEAGAGIYISLHVNSFPTPDCFGAQTFYNAQSPESRRLARLIQEELVRLQPENFREALPGDFYVLRHTRMPAALVEAGFITHAQDRALLQDPAYLERAAGAIARALARYAGGEEAGAGGAPAQRPE
ncbi:MAG TPA: N-acetylmuramoyl-L-alanine amidase [Limnochordia bacterium]